MEDGIRQVALATKGFLAEEEGVRLYELARSASVSAPCLEIGSYCGKSALFLGAGCRDAGAHPVFTVDHHRGNAEQQPGHLYFDPELYDEDGRSHTTLEALVRNIRLAALDDWVIPLVSESRLLARYWPDESLGLLFIDGGHSREDAFGDYHGWARCIARGGYLCVHDVFEDPRDGGQAPYEVVQTARRSGGWDDFDPTGTLAVLRRR